MPFNPLKDKAAGEYLIKENAGIQFSHNLVITLLVPIPMRLKDGGTVKYQALLYSVSKVHRLAPLESEKEYEEGTIINILGIDIYNDVQ